MLLVAVTATTVLGFPSGAPPLACPNIYPVGHNTTNNTANGTIPFTVNTSSLTNYTYTPGAQHASKH